MSAPALYRDSDGGIKRFDSTRETVIDCQGIAALTNTSAASLFDDVTSGNITVGAALTGNLTVGNTAGNYIMIDNTGDNRVEVVGNFHVTGTETVTGNTQFDEDVTLGDASGDLITVNGTTTFNADATFADSTTVNFGTTANVTVDTTYARFNDDLTFDGAAARAVTNDSNDLTVSTTTSGDVLLTGADHVTVTVGTTAGDGFAVTNGTKLDLIYVDGNTGDMMINTPTPLPAGATAALTVNQDTADQSVIALTSGATETCLLTGSTAPNGAVSAPVGSLYLRNTGALYVRAGALDVWAEIGTTSSSNLQAAYDAGQTIVLDGTASADLLFTVDETVTTADFKVDGPTGDYFLADAANKKIVLGSATVPIDAANDIEMTGTTPSINATSLDLSLTTTTAGNIIINPAASGEVGIGTASPSADTMATIAHGDYRVVTLQNTGTGAAATEIQTGTTAPGGTVTGLAGSLYLQSEATGNAKAFLNTSAAASGTVWTEMGLDAAVDLQDAYDNSGNPADVTMAINKDVTFTLNETGGTEADFIVTGASGNHIRADASGPELILGAAGVAVTSAGVVTSIESANTYIGDANTDVLTVNCGTTWFETSANPKTIQGAGTNVLTLTGTTGGLDLATTTAALNITTTTGDITVKPSSTGDIFVQNASSKGLQIEDTGAITVLGGGANVSIADGSGAAGILLAGATGAITVDNAAVAAAIGISAGTNVTILSGSDALGGDITIDATEGTGGGGVEIDADTASYFTVATGSLTLSTTGSGDISVTGAADIDLAAASGEVTVSSGTAEVMSLLTGTVDPSASATAANAGSLFMRDSTNGELYIKQDDGSSTNWDRVATIDDAGDVVAEYTTAETCAVGDLMYLTATAGEVGLADADVAAKVRPIGIALDADGVGGAVIRVALAGEVTINETAFVAGDIGKYVYMDTTTPGGYILDVSGYGTGDTVLRVGVLSLANGVAKGTMVISFGEPTLL